MSLKKLRSERIVTVLCQIGSRIAPGKTAPQVCGGPLGEARRISGHGKPARRSAIALLVLFVSLATPARAQQVQELTADESVRLGLERNPRVRVARAQAAEAQAIHRQARAARLPSISTLASHTRLVGNVPPVEFTIPGLPPITVLPIEPSRYHAEISLQQPLFTGGRLQHEIRAAAHLADAVSLAGRQEQAQVAFEIRRAYWTLYQAIAVREALGASLRQVEAHLADVRLRLEVGAALTSDLLAAQTRQSEVLLERVEADNAVRVAGLELNRLVGLPLDTAVRPVQAVAVEPMPAALDPPADGALDESPRLRALREEVGAMTAELRAAEARRIPEVDFVSRFIYARPNPFIFAEPDRFRSVLEVGLSAQWDIWRGGRRPAEEAAARARLSAAEARLAEIRDEAAVEVARQRLEVRRAREAVEVARLNVQQAEEAFRVLRRQFDEGVAISVEVLDAEQALRAAQSRNAAALADYAIAQAAVLFSVGRVW